MTRNDDDLKTVNVEENRIRIKINTSAVGRVQRWSFSFYFNDKHFHFDEIHFALSIRRSENAFKMFKI